MTTTKKRDSFRSKWGFILACIGSAVGMGNIWMFPMRVSKYGGGAFILVYLVMIFFLTSSGVVGEMGLGRSTRSGPMGAFNKAVASRGGNGKIGEGLGLIPTVASLLLAIGYSVVVGWIIKYTIGAFSGVTLALADPDAFGAEFGGTASHLGNNIWLWVGIVGTIVILILGIGGGIEKANKLMMPLFFLLFAGLAVYVAFQPGSAAGYRYIFSIDPKALANPMTYVYALGQATFSLSLGGSGTLIYGSYLSDAEDIPVSARSVGVFDTLAALLATMVIIPALASAGQELNMGGPGLMFIALPNLFKTMPGGGLISIVFFVAVLFAGVTSLINLFETSIATLQEKLNLSRIKACVAIAAVGLLVATFIQGIVGEWMDVVSIYINPIGAVLAAIMFFWVFGDKFVKDELQKGRTKPLPGYIIPLSKYVYTVAIIAVVILGIVFKGIG